MDLPFKRSFEWRRWPRLILILGAFGFFAITFSAYFLFRGPTGTVTYEAGITAPKSPTESQPDFGPLIPPHITWQLFLIAACVLIVAVVVHLCVVELPLVRKWILPERKVKAGPFVVPFAGFGLLLTLTSTQEPSMPPIAVPSVPTVSRSMEDLRPLSIVAEGPERIYSHQQVPIGITASLGHHPIGEANLLLDGGREYLLVTTLQPGAFDASSDSRVSEDVLRVSTPVRRSWIIAPQLNRIGEQHIIVDVDIHDSAKKKLSTVPVKMLIDVQYPIPVPVWLVYLAPFVGFLALVPALIPIGQFFSTDLANRLKEGRELKKQRAAEIASAKSQEEGKPPARPGSKTEPPHATKQLAPNPPTGNIDESGQDDEGSNDSSRLETETGKRHKKKKRRGRS